VRHGASATTNRASVASTTTSKPLVYKPLVD
jgi:hypothetical protein